MRPGPLALLPRSPAVTFDDAFAKLVRLTGWGLGVWAVVAGKLSGSETIAVVLGFVGFEFVVGAGKRKAAQVLERDE